MNIKECQHGKRVGKAGISTVREQPWAGMFCPKNKVDCLAVFFRVSLPNEENK